MATIVSEVRRREGRDQLVPRRHRDADREQQRIGDRATEELVDEVRAMLQFRRHDPAELRRDREQQHRDRRRDPEQLE